jgi:uncharacterized phosphosugar-binding protein
MKTESPANVGQQYYRQVQSLLCRIVESQMAAIRGAAELVADTVQRDGIIYGFGRGHSSMAAVELYYRAGSLVNFDIIEDRTFGRAERLPGYAESLLDAYPISSADLLIIVSNSGRNAAPVEMALGARRRGIVTIGITSLGHSRSIGSRAPGGRRLFEICDLVIDSCVPPGDATVEIGPPGAVRVCPASTLAAIFIANCISGTAASILLARGVEPPVFCSANLDGSDQRNRKLIDFMRRRIRGL